MDRALYVSMTGAKQIMQAQAIIAQNLANVSTSGFREDLHAFSSLQVNGAGFHTRVNSVAQTVGFSSASGVKTNTGAPLDLAIRGDGWFAVQARDGTEAYTRAGDFHLSPEGVLLTADGLPVLGDSGPVTVPPSNTLTVGSDGTISVVPQGVGPKGSGAVARLKLVNPPLAMLVKGEDGMFRQKDGTPAAPDARVAVDSGALESSNVNAARSLVDMIQASRLFDMQIKLMSSIDQDAQTSQKLTASAA
jgi:flagellar basal-body rod protein FlgF